MDKNAPMVMLAWFVVFVVCAVPAIRSRERRAIETGQTTAKGDLATDLAILGFVTFIGVAIAYLAIGAAWEWLAARFQ